MDEDSDIDDLCPSYKALGSQAPRKLLVTSGSPSIGNVLVYIQAQIQHLGERLTRIETSRRQHSLPVPPPVPQPCHDPKCDDMLKKRYEPPLCYRELPTQSSNPQDVNDSEGIIGSRAKPPDDKSRIPADKNPSSLSDNERFTRASDQSFNIHSQINHFIEND